MKNPARSMVIALAICLLATSSQSKPSLSDGGACASVAGLKAAYLRCERAAQSDRLASGDIAQCSQIYYDLKDTAFGGDFARIRAWYDTLTAVGPQRALGVIRPSSATEECR